MPQLLFKTPAVTDRCNISPCLVTFFRLEYSTASRNTELWHCDMEEKIPVSNVDLENSPLLGDIDNEDESHDLEIYEETVDEEQIADSVGRKKKGNLLVEDQVLEAPVQQNSNSEAQEDEECSKEYLRENPISVVNDEGLEDELNDSKTTKGYQVSVVENEEQIEQFSKSETLNAQETLYPKDYNEEAGEAMKDEAHEIKFSFSNKRKVCFGLDEFNGPQKEEGDNQYIYENEAYEGEPMDFGNTPELKNKLQFDADNLNGAHQFKLLPRALSLENLSQLASYSEDQEPGEYSEMELLVLNDVHKSHISLVNGEVQEDKFSDPKTIEGFHDYISKRGAL